MNTFPLFRSEPYDLRNTALNLSYINAKIPIKNHTFYQALQCRGNVVGSERLAWSPQVCVWRLDEPTTVQEHRNVVSSSSHYTQTNHDSAAIYVWRNCFPPTLLLKSVLRTLNRTTRKIHYTHEYREARCANSATKCPGVTRKDVYGDKSFAFHYLNTENRQRRAFEKTTRVHGCNLKRTE